MDKVRKFAEMFAEEAKMQPEVLEGCVRALLSYAASHGITDPREAVEAYRANSMRLFERAQNDPEFMADMRDYLRPFVRQKCREMAASR